MAKLISIKEYAAKHGVLAASVKQKALRGNLPQAFKIGTQWVIPEDAPYTDGRIKSGEYKNWRSKMSKFSKDYRDNLESFKNTAPALYAEAEEDILSNTYKVLTWEQGDFTKEDILEKINKDNEESRIGFDPAEDLKTLEDLEAMIKEGRLDVYASGFITWYDGE